MPAIHDSQSVGGPLADSLAPRELDNLITRHPALHSFPNRAASPSLITERDILERRAVQGIIPTYYNFNGPAPATVAGIVLGSVAGFLLVLWLLYSLTQLGGGGAHIAGEEEIVVRRPRRGSHGTRSRRSTRTEVRERSRSPRPRSTVIVEERRPPPRPRSIIVDERSRSRVPGDDVVEVIEEHDEYRSRRGGRRSGGYR